MKIWLLFTTRGFTNTLFLNTFYRTSGSRSVFSDPNTYSFWKMRISSLAASPCKFYPHLWSWGELSSSKALFLLVPYGLCNIQVIVSPINFNFRFFPYSLLTLRYASITPSGIWSIIDMCVSPCVLTLFACFHGGWLG